MKTKNDVTIRIKKFPSTFNSYSSSSSIESILEKETYSTLYWFGEKNSVRPLLARDVASIEVKSDTTILTLYIRDEAKWKNRKDISSRDVLFSLKVFKLPFTHNINSRVHLERIKKVKTYRINKKKIEFWAIGTELDVSRLIGDFDILEKDKYDSLGLLDHITFEEINSSPEKVAEDIKVKEFVSEFLKDNYKFKGQYFEGSGPYKIIDMEAGKYIRLKKKQYWWGEELANILPQFHAYPDEITYVCIPEPLVAIQALKSRSIDVMDDIPANEFVQLKDNIEFQKDYNLFSPLKYKFTYIGFNSRISKLEKLEIRKALSYLIKVNDIIKVVERGYGQKTIGPINPANDFYYNNQINNREYNPTLAQKIFVQNGYYMEEGKLIDPQTNRQLEFSVSYRQNPGYESIASIFKQEAKKIGMKINLTQYEGRTISKMARNHDFEILVGAFSGNPHSLNFSGLFSREASKVGGMNFTGFGNYKSDSLIQAANYAQDSISKKQALYAFQEELHDESTMIFLYFSKNKIAINKKFENVKISATKPGYDVTSFILKSSEVSK